MSILEVIMILSMVTIGTVCAYSDIRKAIVSNRAILIGLALATLCNLAYYLSADTDYWRNSIPNLIISAILAVLMYAGGLWAAGDTKLYITLYAFMPAKFFEDGSFAPAVLPFAFIFLSAYLWTIIDSVILIREGRKRFDNPLKAGRNLRGWITVLIEVSAIRELLLLLVPEFVGSNAFFCATLMMVYAMICGRWAVMKKKTVIILHGIVAIVVAIILHTPIALPGISSYVIFALLYLMQQWLSGYNYQEIPTSSVTRGMILSATTIMRFLTSKVHNLPTNASEGMDARISEDEANAVRRWEHSVQGSPVVVIVRKIPFAIMIVTGFILWLISIVVRWWIL